MERYRRMDFATSLLLTVRGIPIIFYGDEQYLDRYADCDRRRPEYGQVAPEDVNSHDDDPYNRVIMTRGSGGICSMGAARCVVWPMARTTHLPRVKVDADLHGNLMYRAGFVGAAVDGVLYSQHRMEPFRSANSMVTCLHSPSRATLEVRIFSANTQGYPWRCMREAQNSACESVSASH